jgi:hypothetical protein
LRLILPLCAYSSAWLSHLDQKRIDGFGRRTIPEDPLGIVEPIHGQEREDPSAIAPFIAFGNRFLQNSIADEHLARQSSDRTGANGAEQPSLPHVAHPGQSVTIFEPDYFILILISWIHDASFLWAFAGSFQIVQNDLLRAGYPAVDKANLFPVNQKGVNESGNFLAGRIGYLKGDFQGVNYPQINSWACGSAKNRATMGILTDARAAIFRAATMSAGSEKPQQIQQNSSLVGRLDREI